MNLAVVILSALLLTGPRVKDVELVTVDDASFTVSCVTDSETTVTMHYGEDEKSLDGSVSSSGTRFHYITAEGLEPGTTYYYRVESGGASRPPSFMRPEKVLTLRPPPGRELFTFAVMNDIHVGEDIAGLMVPPVSWLPPFTNGFTWRDPADNYWAFTLRAAIRGINRSGAELCVINGDLTSWFTEEEFLEAKSLLDLLQMPYYVTRGNHDRVGDYPEDYFKKTFGLKSSWYSVDHAGFHFVMLDDNRLSDGWQAFPEQEWEWLEQDLASHRDERTFLFVHRPVGAGGVDVLPSIRNRMFDVIAANPQVAAVFNAHSHMARIVTVPDRTGDTPYIEVPAVKEYPVGYGLVRVFEGGFMYNFHLADCPDCREWNHITRGEYFGTAPHRLMRGLEDRNMTYVFKKSGD